MAEEFVKELVQDILKIIIEYKNLILNGNFQVVSYHEIWKNDLTDVILEMLEVGSGIPDNEAYLIIWYINYKNSVFKIKDCDSADITFQYEVGEMLYNYHHKAWKNKEPNKKSFCQRLFGVGSKIDSLTEVDNIPRADEKPYYWDDLKEIHDVDTEVILFYYSHDDKVESDPKRESPWFHYLKFYEKCHPKIRSLIVTIREHNVYETADYLDIIKGFNDMDDSKSLFNQLPYLINLTKRSEVILPEKFNMYKLKEYSPLSLVKHFGIAHIRIESNCDIYKLIFDWQSRLPKVDKKNLEIKFESPNNKLYLKYKLSPGGQLLLHGQCQIFRNNTIITHIYNNGIFEKIIKTDSEAYDIRFINNGRFHGRQISINKKDITEYSFIHGQKVSHEEFDEWLIKEKRISPELGKYLLYPLTNIIVKYLGERL